MVPETYPDCCNKLRRCLKPTRIPVGKAQDTQNLPRFQVEIQYYDGILGYFADETCECDYVSLMLMHWLYFNPKQQITQIKNTALLLISMKAESLYVTIYLGLTANKE
jgi:hypothetical protein